MKNTLSRLTIITCMVLQTSFLGNAQLVDFSKILTGGTDDAELIIQEYISPVTTALGANLNSGWYNTAKTHDLLGFHITFTTSVALIPDAAKTYDLDELNLNAQYDASDNIARTVAGEKISGPNLRYEQNVPGYPGNPVVLAQYDHPAGINLNFVPSPMISAGIGLIKGIEIDGRYMPTIKYGSDKENTVDLWGIGIKHDLKQWIPVVNKVPVFQLAVQYGYTSLKWHTNFNPVTPATFGATDQTTGINWDDQSLDFQTKAHTANLLVGANLPVVCFYGGVGFSMAKTNLVTNGWYPIPTVVTEVGPDLGEVVVTNTSALENPIDFEIKAKDGSTTKPRLNAGIRFKLAIVTIHFDYTYANYSVVTAGLGITFR
jgi:hypothetical protein